MTMGFIGTGSMGRTLIEAFIRSGRFVPSDLFIRNRTREKAEQIAREYPGLRIAKNNQEVARQSQLLFLCVKPKEFRQVFDEIKEIVTSNQIVISITSPVMIRDLEEWLPCKVVKVIPSITQSVLAGNSLFIPGSRLTEKDKEHLWELFSAISQPILIQEENTRVASDLASCSPAFFANLMEKLAQAAVEETTISKDTAHLLVGHMAQGLGRLLTEGGYSLETLQERVAVPGGVTRKGLQLLEEQVGPVFHDLIHLTHEKYEEDIHMVQQSLASEVGENA